MFDPLCPINVIKTFNVVAKEMEKPSDDYVIEFDEKCYVCQQAKENPVEEEESLMVCDECNFKLAHYQCE